MKRRAEHEVQADVRNFLEQHGWRVLRMMSGKMATATGIFTLGEPGMADLLAHRYTSRGRGLILWCETKHPNVGKARCRCLEIAANGKRKLCTTCAQKQWHATEKERGAQVITVSDFDWFIGEYQRVYGFLHAGDQARGQLELGAFSH